MHGFPNIRVYSNQFYSILNDNIFGRHKIGMYSLQNQCSKKNKAYFLPFIFKMKLEVQPHDVYIYLQNLCKVQDSFS